LQRQILDLNYMITGQSDNMREMRKDLAEIREKLKPVVDKEQKEGPQPFTDDGLALNLPDRLYVVTNTFILANN
jgi:hypothetical protein